MVEDTAHLKAFHMPFDSMEPTIATGAKVIGDVGYYGSNRPQRWEVVVFSLPGNDGEFIKRIVGLPGEKITLGPAGLLVDGSPVDPPVALKKCFSKFRGCLQNQVVSLRSRTLASVSQIQASETRASRS